ncbi:MAG: GNAT family N-acetyltransferase [Christensenellaceae bacterium]|jgi:GNAT superfamily N-acetyltransferase|nr:GNAT family N-acetyltransferase [Christensenellaceae bacterium]
MIEPLGAERAGWLYHTRLQRDFPRAELRPLFWIKALLASGNYSLLTWSENGEMLAYAALIHGDGIGGVLLDYFAVEEGSRGQGIGGRFLGELRAYLGEEGKAGLLIESELPKSAQNAEERAIRERRIAFYARCGAEQTGLGWRVFSVDYALLWLPMAKATAEVSPGEDVQALYALSMPSPMRAAALKLYKLP